MGTTEVYLGLGGNVGDTSAVLRQALNFIAAVRGVDELKVSRFYSTTPVSPIPQNDYVNAACRLKTTLSAHQLLAQLQHIEKHLGKMPKHKNDPRVIDIDILIFGLEIHRDPDLEIPHPRWKERLFVLAPLAELTTEIVFPDSANPGGVNKMDIKEFLKSFPNRHNETVSLAVE